MKVTVERAQLLKSLGHVHRVVERRNTIPILGNVLLRAENAQLSLKATDLDLEVTETDPGLRGDTASGGGTKPATLETGVVVQVPLFISTGETIKVDTREGRYLSRA